MFFVFLFIGGATGNQGGDSSDQGPWQHRYPSSRPHHPGGHLRSFMPQSANQRQLRTPQNNTQPNRTAAGSQSPTSQNPQNNAQKSSSNASNSNSLSQDKSGPESEPLWVPQKPTINSSGREGVATLPRSQQGEQGPLLSNQNGSLGNQHKNKFNGVITPSCQYSKNNGAIRTESGEKEYVLLAARFADEDSADENSDEETTTSGSYMVEQDNNKEIDLVGGQSKVTRDVTV